MRVHVCMCGVWVHLRVQMLLVCKRLGMYALGPEVRSHELVLPIFP